MIYEGPLGAHLPEEKPYVEKYALDPVDHITTTSPAVLACNWYTNFDNPQKDSTGRWWIGRSANLGSVRGGHAIAMKDRLHKDYEAWWTFYNQGTEGACVGFAVCRNQSLHNGTRYDGFWHYHEAQKHDPWAGENYSGTSLDAGLWVAKNMGLVRVPLGTPMGQEELIVRPGAGIAAYRWATSVDDIVNTLDLTIGKQLEAVPLLNSWGAYYPRVVWMPYNVLDRLLREYGEIGVATDR
jgi:hypothetical protein